MEIILSELGIVLVITGLPLYFSCEIQAAWVKRSRAKSSQAREQGYQ
jgi:hypothetical protein